MNIKKHIPNFLTCCNLLCGCLGIIFCLSEFSSRSILSNLCFAAVLIFIACVFDFLDGFIARLLKVQSPIGKELDSLADVVTFGVLPGMILFKLFSDFSPEIQIYTNIYELSFIALLIPVFSALRLAKFNIDIRQSESFIGVPTPANAILIASLPLIVNSRLPDFYNLPVPPLAGIDLGFFDPIISFILNPFFLTGLTLLMSYLLVAELPLFALKFKNFKWAGNEIRFVFLGMSVLLLIALKWLGIPIIIFLYIILSVVDNLILKKTHEIKP
jgi:CDP-diacylglycerol---serine O-phosphatidyltransferase